MRRLLAAVLLAGCATPPPAPEILKEPTPRVLAAVLAELRAYADVVVEGSVVTTSWGPERDLDREQGYLLDNHYKIRVRHRLELEPLADGTALHVRSTLERRAPGGPRSLRWERVPSDGKPERELLNAVARRLEREAAGEFLGTAEALVILLPADEPLQRKAVSPGIVLFTARTGYAVMIEETLETKPLTVMVGVDRESRVTDVLVLSHRAPHAGGCVCRDRAFLERFKERALAVVKESP